MARNPAQVAQTKQNLREAFWELYKDKRIDKISIKEITDKAGYNRGTFYLYYKDVYDILEQLEDELLSSLNEISDILVKFVISKEDYIGDYIRLIAYLKENNKYISVLFGEHGDAYFQSRYKEVLKECLKEHIDMNAVEYSEDTIDFSLEFFISGLLGLILYYLAKHKEPDIQALTKIFRGIVSQTNISDYLK